MSNRRILMYKLQRAQQREFKRLRMLALRFDPFKNYDDNDFYIRYRFDKNTVRILVHEFGDGLASHTSRSDIAMP